MSGTAGGPDAALLDAEQEIAVLNHMYSAGVEGPIEVEQDILDTIRERINELEDEIRATRAVTLAGVAVQIRRPLDAWTGLLDYLDMYDLTGLLSALATVERLAREQGIYIPPSPRRLVNPIEATKGYLARKRGEELSGQPDLGGLTTAMAQSRSR